MGIQNGGPIRSLVWQLQAHGVYLLLSCAILLSSLEDLLVSLPYLHPFFFFLTSPPQHYVSH